MRYDCISVTDADGIPREAIEARDKACRDFWEACRRVAELEFYHDMLAAIPAIEKAIADIRQPLMLQQKPRGRRKVKPKLRVRSA
jgi:hypothetical protein